MGTALVALLILIILVGYGHYQQHPDDRAKLVAQATMWLHGVILAIPVEQSPATSRDQEAGSEQFHCRSRHGFFDLPRDRCQYEPPSSRWVALTLLLGPLAVNTFLGMFTGWPAVFAMLSHGNDPFEFLGDLFLLWLGVSIAVHSIPTFKDARAVAQVLGTSRHPIWARQAGNLISACFYADAIVSMFWFDVIYSLTIVVGLPFLLFEAFLKA